MKQFPSLVLACALAIPVLAQEVKTDTVTSGMQPAKSADAGAQPPGQSFAASAATLTAPMVLTNDYLVMAADQQEVAGGGKAVFNFSVTNAGSYQIEALASAPDESSNSFYANIDAQPMDPDMIWDIPVTSGFEKRVISWRGNGDSATDEFTPKTFKLEAGAHTLVIVGREPGTLLKSVTIFPAPPEKPATP
jgi:hypothetical protein